MYKTDEIEISSQKDVFKASSIAKSFSEEIFIIVSELATNILKHAKDNRGTIQIIQNPDYTKIVSRNEGELKDEDFIDERSSKNTLGIGLGAVGRISDKLSYSNKEGIVEIICYKCKNSYMDMIKTAGLSYGKIGTDEFNGDAYIKIVKNTYVLVGVIDILGHGKDAHIAAEKAKRFIERNHYLDIQDIVLLLHKYLKNERLRGGMVELAKFACNIEEKSEKSKLPMQITFCGVGDVSYRMFEKDNAKESKTYKVLSLPTSDGVVGENLRKKPLKQTVDFKVGSIAVLFSDGLSTKLKIDEDLAEQNLIELTHSLMKRYGKETDDRTLLLVKLFPMEKVWVVAGD